MQLGVADEEAMRDLGRWFADLLRDGGFLGLVGPLGAGKTTLMQGLVGQIDRGGQWQASSPTYALVNAYETSPPIFHVDLYRLEGWADLESIGYWDFLDVPGAITCVEWLDRIPGAWPRSGIIAEVRRWKSSRRVIVWTDGQWETRLSAPGQQGVSNLTERRRS